MAYSFQMQQIPFLLYPDELKEESDHEELNEGDDDDDDDDDKGIQNGMSEGTCTTITT